MIETSGRVAGIVLAAGNSARLGRDKLSVTLHGRSLLDTAVARAQQVCDEVLVVLREGGVAPSDRSVGRVVNPNPRQGLGSSIAIGAAAVARWPIDALLIMLPDQYQITAHELRFLIKKWQKTTDFIVVSDYGEVVGPPVIFPRRCFASLERATTVTGARHLVTGNRVARVSLPQAAIDLDLPEDLDRLRQFEQTDQSERETY